MAPSHPLGFSLLVFSVNPLKVKLLEGDLRAAQKVKEKKEKKVKEKKEKKVKEKKEKKGKEEKQKRKEKKEKVEKSHKALKAGIFQLESLGDMAVECRETSRIARKVVKKWVWVKQINHHENHKFESLFPFTRVPFWVHILTHSQILLRRLTHVFCSRA